VNVQVVTLCKIHALKEKKELLKNDEVFHDKSFHVAKYKISEFPQKNIIAMQSDFMKN
jgi:hypothetical protein